LATLEDVLETRRYYSNVGVWPPPSDMIPVRWLENFTPSEKSHALALLDAFLYFNARFTDQLFASAFHAMSADLVAGVKTYDAKRSAWRQFTEEVLVTRPTGERPSDTDSGYMFARKARQLLGIAEDRILAPEQILETVATSGPRSVVFVDDFAGSGDQFRTTWERKYEIRGGELSFLTAAEAGLLRTIDYCLAVCTEHARVAIADSAPAVRIRPSHLLPLSYGILHSETLLLPPQLVPTAHDFVLTASARAGISPADAFGYENLGLALAFEHSVPDATLPLFHHEDNGWIPLVRRV
jgi:hypothetical protein